jgi:1,4-dihydroxy-2-naphthoate octaprenyltransferase
MKSWISAARPRTLPLAAASIGMGGFLAYFHGLFDWVIFMLCLTTTLLLQILSNLANDYGDHMHGADHSDRIGPVRMVQSGEISAEKMKSAMIGVAVVTFFIGMWLLIRSLGVGTKEFYIMLTLGILSILAAVKYTSGKKPYGYQGLGDLAVIVFFGLVAVLGSYYLQTGNIRWDHLLPAISCGSFATAVLNVNNIRDIDSDRKAGKLSIPVRIGRSAAIRYHWVLLFTGLICSVVFTAMNFRSVWQWLFLLVVPLIYLNGAAVMKKTGQELDPYLKQMAITTLLYVVTFGLGLVISS